MADDRIFSLLTLQRRVRATRDRQFAPANQSIEPELGEVNCCKRAVGRLRACYDSVGFFWPAHHLGNGSKQHVCRGELDMQAAGACVSEESTAVMDVNWSTPSGITLSLKSECRQDFNRHSESESMPLPDSHSWGSSLRTLFLGGRDSVIRWLPMHASLGRGRYPRPGSPEIKRSQGIGLPIPADLASCPNGAKAWSEILSLRGSVHVPFPRIMHVPGDGPLLCQGPCV